MKQVRRWLQLKSVKQFRPDHDGYDRNYEKYLLENPIVTLVIL